MRKINAHKIMILWGKRRRLEPSHAPSIYMSVLYHHGPIQVIQKEEIDKGKKGKEKETEPKPEAKEKRDRRGGDKKSKKRNITSLALGASDWWQT